MTSPKSIYRFIVSVSCLAIGLVGWNARAARATSGLVAIYDFGAASGAVVKDRSGVRPGLDLRISNLKAVRRTMGVLEVRGKTVIRSDQPAAKIFNGVRRSGAITIEAWVKPANTRQDGPARMVTLSRDTSSRNFTMGQDKDRFETRFRTSGTSLNGVPAVITPTKSARVAVMHVVYSRSRAGRVRMFLNGKRVAEKMVPGAISNWAGDYRLALANEMTGDRPWLGTFYLVAI